MRSFFGTRGSTIVTIEPSAARFDQAAYEISVVSYQGKPPATSMSAVFGHEGGTIGRGTNNTLVLPDPNRFVSRVQSRIFFDGAGIKIANASAANPLLLNDRELDAGAEEPLRNGDELRIGLYVLKVKQVDVVGAAATTSSAATAVDRPPGKPMSPATTPAAAQRGSTPPPTSPKVASAPSHNWSTSRGTSEATSLTPAPAGSETPASAAAFIGSNVTAGSLGPVDPLQLQFGQAGDDPFADLIQPSPALPTQSAGAAVPQGAASMSKPPATGALGANTGATWPTRDTGNARDAPTAQSAPSAQEIPEHVWDDLAQLAPSASPAAPLPTPLPPSFDAFAQPSGSARNAEDPLAEFAQNAVALESLDKLDTPIDTLFPDSPLRSRGGEEVIPDPHAQAPDPLGARDSLDPIAIFDEASARRDSLDSVFGRSERDDVPEIEAFFRPPQPTLDAAPASQPPLTHPQEDASRGNDHDDRPASIVDDPLALLRSEAQPRETSVARSGAMGTSRAEGPLQDAPRIRESRPGTYDELVREFLAGAGIPHVTMQDPLTPALMRRIGRMLAIAVQGTIELIAARALVKREVKADVTIIASTRNNPLKFLPDAESALLQMFGARIPGFMEPVEAMEDAYRDLRAHEVGVIAGMHAALAEVLKRFEPAELERRLKPGGVLESLLPNSRQARLWETFAEMYVDISREAQDDFQSLFGKAFLHAYESEVSRLKGQ